MALERDATSDVLLTVAESVSSSIGHEFLRKLVEALRDSMDVSIAFITTGEGRPVSRARAVYAIEDSEPLLGLSYELDGTPCAAVYAGDRVTIPCELTEAFPREAGLEGYSGAPLRNERGDVTGHLAVLSTKPILEPAICESVLRIFAQRVEAERRRQEFDAKRDEMLSELARLNEKLRKRYVMVHDANAFKTKVLGMIAHDLRNPLASIIAHAELLQMRIERTGVETADKLEKPCDRILANADRMNALIDTTLKRVREEASSLTLSYDTVDLNQIARLAIEANQHFANLKSITIHTDFAEEAAIIGDEDLLIEAIDNLVNNAIKYGKAGGWVLVAINCSDSKTVLSVSDDGQGMTDDDLLRVFGRFQTLSAKPTTGETATGLGLSNVKEIAEAHGGIARATSEGRDRGSKFVIELPRRAIAAP